MLPIKIDYSDSIRIKISSPTKYNNSIVNLQVILFISW